MQASRVLLWEESLCRGSGALFARVENADNGAGACGAEGCGERGPCWAGHAVSSELHKTLPV